MIKKKILFSMLIMFFLFALVFFTLAFNFVIDLPKKDIVIISPKDNIHEMFSCIPLLPDDPTILIRLDDIGANIYRKIRFDLINKVLNNGLAIFIGVIPEGIENDDELKEFVKNNIDNPRFEVAQHGVLHLVEEFKDLSENDAYNRLKEGQSIIFSELGIYPVTFVPPYNVYSKGTTFALRRLGFKVISAAKDELKFDGGLFYLGENAETFSSDEQVLVSVNTIINRCKQSLELRNICVITVHPQDYLDGEGNIDPTKYKSFDSMINKLKELDAEFKLPSDLLYCFDQTELNNFLPGNQ